MRPWQIGIIPLWQGEGLVFSIPIQHPICMSINTCLELKVKDNGLYFNSRWLQLFISKVTKSFFGLHIQNIVGCEWRCRMRRHGSSLCCCCVYSRVHVCLRVLRILSICACDCVCVEDRTGQDRGAEIEWSCLMTGTADLFREQWKVINPGKTTAAMRAVHFSAIWLGINASVLPGSFQTHCVCLCVYGVCFFEVNFSHPEASGHGRPAFCGTGLARTVTTFLQIADHLVAFRQPSCVKRVSLGRNNGQDYFVVMTDTRAGTSFPQNTCQWISLC